MPLRPESPLPVKRKTYTQSWSECNAAQTNEKVHFQDLLAELCRTIPEPPPQARHSVAPSSQTGEQLFERTHHR